MKRFSLSKFISLSILSVAGLCFSTAMFFVIRFYTSPSPYSLSFDSQNEFLNYALWRGSLLPTSINLIAIGFSTVLLSISFYPLVPKYRKAFTIFIIAFLEEQLAVWGSWLLSHVPHYWTLWSYDPFPLLDSVFGGSVAICFFLLACAALVSVQIKFNSIPGTLQVMSLSLVPLPLYVYFFDSGEFYIHFQNALTSLSFITNSDLLVTCVLVFSFSTAYQFLRRSSSSSSRRFSGLT